MPRRADSRRLPYTPEQLFDLVADIARYPEFVPGVAAARVRAVGGETRADLVAAFGSFRERFTSRVELERPRQVRATLVEGPLSRLENSWRFTPEGEGTRVDFFVDFAFRSRTLNAAAERVFDRAFLSMVDAFEARAAACYDASSSDEGISSSSAHSAA